MGVLKIVESEIQHINSDQEMNSDDNNDTTIGLKILKDINRIPLYKKII